MGAGRLLRARQAQLHVALFMTRNRWPPSETLVCEWMRPLGMATPGVEGVGKLKNNFDAKW